MSNENAVTQPSEKAAQASIELTFSPETPEHIIQSYLSSAFKADSVTPTIDTVTREDIILLDMSNDGSEFLATDVQDYEYDTEANCTAITTGDGTVDLYTNTVPVNPEYANHTIEELRNE
jgi:hypothetical protein